jgi:hypothetical protein
MEEWNIAHPIKAVYDASSEGSYLLQKLLHTLLSDVLILINITDQLWLNIFITNMPSASHDADYVLARNNFHKRQGHCTVRQTLKECGLW